MSFQTVQWNSRQAGEAWVRQILPKINIKSLVLLSGPLGAGKTQVVTWFLKALGGTHVSSPTFAIHQEYRLTGRKVDHVDLYRLTSDADLESSGFWDLLRQEQGLIFVEWADRLPAQVWPRDWQKIEIEIQPGSGAEWREVRHRVTPPGFP